MRSAMLLIHTLAAGDGSNTPSDETGLRWGPDPAEAPEHGQLPQRSLLAIRRRSLTIGAPPSRSLPKVLADPALAAGQAVIGGSGAGASRPAKGRPL